MVVEVATGMLEAIDDIGLADSIVEEAVKIEVCDRLGGLDAVRLSKFEPPASPPVPTPSHPTASFLAKVKFAELSNSILSLQGEYDRLVGALAAMRSVAVAALEAGDAAGHTEALVGIRNSLEEACTPTPVMPRLIPQWEADLCESSASRRSSSTDASRQSMGGYEPLGGGTEDEDDDGDADEGEAQLDY